MPVPSRVRVAMDAASVPMRCIHGHQRTVAGGRWQAELVIAQDQTRVDAITNTGGAILGHRPLELGSLTSRSLGRSANFWAWSPIAPDVGEPVNCQRRRESSDAQRRDEEVG